MNTRKYQTTDRTSDEAAAPSRRPYSPPTLTVYKLSDVVRGGGSGPFDIDGSATGGPPQPPG